MVKPNRTSRREVLDAEIVAALRRYVDDVVASESITIAPSLSSKEMLSIAQEAVRQFEKMPPRPPHVTQKDAANMLGLSTATVSRKVKNGEIRLNRCGMIPISEIDRILAER